jgi:acetolactate synthase I/II/III large subunit
MLYGTLRRLGLTTAFGVPGTQNVELFEGFRRVGIRTVLATHELAAGFMANGYYRATGKPALLATIPGPGFTWALTGLAEARLDSCAVIHLVGTPATSPGHRFQLQSIDQHAIASPLAKGVFTITEATEVVTTLQHAWAVAMGGEPGPVVVQLGPAAQVLDDSALNTVAGAAFPDVPRPSLTEADAAALDELFLRAERPLLFLGQGAVNAIECVRVLVERGAIPVLTTPSGRGTLPESHPMALGFDPLRGDVTTLNEFVDCADLILAIGCKLGHNGTAGFQLRLPADRLVHVDRDPHVLGANYPAVLTILADAEDTLTRLAAIDVHRRARCRWNVEQIADVRAALRSPPRGELEPAFHGVPGGRPAGFFEALGRALPPDSIVVTDSGLHQILTRRYHDVLRPRSLLFPSDFQSMGYGLPAAIGAKVAAPERPVVACVGDGCFLMSGLELLTAIREHVPLVLIVFNDGHLNQIRLRQMQDFGAMPATRLRNPDFKMLANAFGCGYARFEDMTPAQFARMLRSEAVSLVEVTVADSPAIRKTAFAGRAKRSVRRALRSRLGRWLKQ